MSNRETLGRLFIVNAAKCEQRLLAIDPSLTASGWALFSLVQTSPIAVGVVCPPGTGMPLSQRYDRLQEQVHTLFSRLAMRGGDVLVCEGPAPLVLNPDSALKVERVRSIFESVARMFGLAVPGRVNPRTVQTELLGMKGKQLSRSEVKQWARETVLRLYGDALTSMLVEGVNDPKKTDLPQDVVDALLIGSLAVSRVRMAERSGLTLETVFESRGRQRENSDSRWAASGWTEEQVKRLQKPR